VETLINNRGKGSGVVIMSLDDEYNSLIATQYELTAKKEKTKVISSN